ncbi:MAG: restriction endonuclease subunit S [Candidatus Methanoperedens sp.]|nr:restriction endonuclease subunit S [Candidatus Methanoperedens sp.]
MGKVMFSQWTTVTFGEVVRLEQGLCFNKKTNHLMAEKGIPLLRIADLVNNTQTKFVDEERVPKRFIANPKDIIYSRTGQVGLVFKGKVGVVHNNCFRVIPKEGIERDYVYWYLRQPSIIQKARSLAGGAAQPDLSHDAFKSISFTYPEVEIQRRIVAILSAYDDLIENNTRRIKILEDIAQALYREWFVKFRFPGHEKVRMVESELGMVPWGWEVKKLKNISNRIDYGYTASAKKETIGPKFLRITDIVPYLIDWDSVPYCEIADNILTKYELKEGDIVIARTGATTGYGKRINKRHPKTIFASYLVRLRINPEYSNRYIGLIVESSAYKTFIKTNLGGAAQPQANAQILTSIPILLPPKSIQISFDKIIAEIIDQREMLQIKNATLRRTRDLLLPKLISGEVDVENIDVRFPDNRQ